MKSHKQKVVVLDFDHTLFDTDRFFNVDMRAVFRQFGVEDAKWEDSARRASERGYTLDVHLEELGHCSDVIFPEHAAKRILTEQFVDLCTYLYPDVYRFLDRVTGQGYALVLLSFGNEIWQRYKVYGCNLHARFREVLITATHGTKADVVEKLLDTYAEVIAFVDNRGNELDAVRVRFPHVDTYLINRVPKESMCSTSEEDRVRYLEAREIARQGSVYVHRAISSLEDVQL